jgi:DNA-binding MarR family transcriptional regulator
VSVANDLELAEQLSARLNGLRRVLRRRVRATLDGPALAGAQVELLRLVETEPGIGVSAAARSLQLAGNSVSTLVNQLTEAGYLTRETDPADRRSARLFLTDAATKRLTTWRANRAAIVADALNRLDAEQREAIRNALPALANLSELLAEETA